MPSSNLTYFGHLCVESNLTVFIDDCDGMSEEEPVIWVIPAENKSDPAEETGEEEEVDEEELEKQAFLDEEERRKEFERIFEEVQELDEANKNFTFPVIILETGVDIAKVNQYIAGRVSKEKTLLYLVSEETVKILRDNDVRERPESKLEASFEIDVHCYMLTPLIQSHKFFALLYLVTICVWGYHHLIKYRSTLTLLHRIVFFVPVFKLAF